MDLTKALEQARASTEIESSILTAEQKELVEKVIRGEITDAQFNKFVFQLVKKNG